MSNSSNSNSNNNNDNNKKRLNKMASIMSIGSQSHRSESRSAASKSIRSIRDDAIETMVVGVNWAASSDDDRCRSSSYYYDPEDGEHDDHYNNDDDDTTKNSPQQEKGEDTNSSSTTVPTGTISDHSSSDRHDDEEACDLERAAAATVATLVRASRRRANSSSGHNTTIAPAPPRNSAPRLLVRDEPLPRASKSTPCRSWRLLLMNGIGMLLIVGGLAWAGYQYRVAPRYVSVDTGMPVGTVVCPGGSSGSSGIRGINNSSGTLNSNGNATREDTAAVAAVAWTEQQQEQVKEVCGDLEKWKQPCAFAIFYSFTVDDGRGGDSVPSSIDNDGSNSNVTSTTIIAAVSAAASSSHQVYLGVDTWQFGNPNNHECHDQSFLEQKHAEYMAFEHMTIHYKENSNPADTNQYYAPTLHPHTMAAIIAAISCGLGLLFLCSSLLECVC